MSAAEKDRQADELEAAMAERLEKVAGYGVHGDRSRVLEHVRAWRDSTAVVAATLADAACDVGDALKLMESLEPDQMDALAHAVHLITSVAAAFQQEVAMEVTLTRNGIAVSDAAVMGAALGGSAGAVTS